MTIGATELRGLVRRRIVGGNLFAADAETRCRVGGRRIKFRQRLAPRVNSYTSADGASACLLEWVAKPQSMHHTAEAG